MSHKIGFRFDNDEGKKKKLQRLEGVIEYEETEDAETRLAASFELRTDVVPLADDPAAALDPDPVVPVLTVDYRLIQETNNRIRASLSARLSACSLGYFVVTITPKLQSGATSVTTFEYAGGG